MHTMKMRTGTPFMAGIGALLRDMVAEAWATVRLWHRVMKTRRGLEGMDDRMLADLGISRAQADFQLTRSPWTALGRR